MDKRFNPFSEALRNVGIGVDAVFKQTPPPPEIQMAVDEYRGRVAEPGLYELRAIYDNKGWEGLLDYVQSMENATKRWGL